MSSPVTIAVRRESDPTQIESVIEWVEHGLTLARDFDGYLGGGMLRDADDDGVVHVMYRFKDRGALRRWESSDERRDWAVAGDSLVSSSSVQRRTGLEGWFDAPRVRHIIDPRTGKSRMVSVRTAPARWKQVVAIWIGMLPLNILASSVTVQIPWWSALPIGVRSLLMVTTMVPVMTYLIMPAVTRTLKPWLRRRPGLIRSERIVRDTRNAEKLSGRHHDHGHIYNSARLH